ncbi:hypothetical protein D9M71_237860 [compost metagenome]
MPVTAIEQLLHALELARPHGIGDVRLVHDHALHRYQPVIKGRTRLIVGPAAGDQVDRLAAGRARTYPLEEMPRLAAAKINVGQKQVFVEPTPHQRLGSTRTVEQGFPVGNLRSFFGAGHDGVLLHRCPGGEPALQGLVLRIGQAGDRQRHALLGVRLGIGVELPRLWAHIGAIEAQHNLLRQLGIGLQRRVVPLFEHARHQRGLAALGIQYRVKTFAAPTRSAVGIKEQPRRRLGDAAAAVVHRHFRGAPCGPLGTAQVELAGGIVAGVAGHAFLGEDGLDIPDIGDRGGCKRGLPERRTADEQCKGAGKEAMHHVPESFQLKRFTILPVTDTRQHE